MDKRNEIVVNGADGCGANQTWGKLEINIRGAGNLNRSFICFDDSSVGVGRFGQGSVPA